MGKIRARAEPPEPVRTAARPVVLSDELRKALEPWIDVDAVGWEGFEAWLLTVLPALPHPRALETPEGGDRVRALSVALVRAGEDRAASHFRAAEYFRDNQALAQRVKALEAMLRLAKGRGAPGSEGTDDTAGDRATEKYLPHEPDR